MASGATLFGRWRSQLLKKSLQRRAVRVGLVCANVAVLLIVVGIVVLDPGRANGSLQSAAQTANDQIVTAPVDQLASVNIALTVARMANLPEAPAVSNQADSASIQLAVASTDTTVVNKPQAVSSAFVSNKDIHHYTTQTGDTVSSLAAKFGVNSNSILWSNGLLSDYLNAGQALVIPPVNGIVYTVRAGDTPDSLASKFKASKDKIIAYNDAELAGLHVGEQIIIPDGVIVPVYTYTSSSYSGFAWGTGAIYGFNGYDFGNCTWYVATQIAVPANWGNADTWDNGALAAGWHVSSVPTVGAIAQTDAGALGHVGIVIAINADGSQVEIRDMNNYGDGGGFDKVGQGWVSVGTYRYITKP
ncbi:MAG TPA: LysM peptidoglycan-binding domain-containing protein [Candidatus Saccharimonadales bacterium]|nr:LysM peptidoglycan-binding domain-containing protein [Candidatus Saccharimonadales bacterium]